MPTADDLAKLASQLYRGKPSIGAYKYERGLQWDQDAATALGFTSPNFYLWLGEENCFTHAYYRDFYSTTSDYGYHSRTFSNYQAVCIAD